ncbi:MAG: ABC transporter permease [Saprospiraceae bacterium]
MFQYYFKIATRHLWKQRLYSIINISGLAIGLACCIAVLFYVKDELGYDTYHHNADNIYRVAISALPLSVESRYNRANSPILWRPALKRDYPKIETYTRFVKLVNASNP